jgi:hypothetical protein
VNANLKFVNSQQQQQQQQQQRKRKRKLYINSLYVKKENAARDVLI